VDTIGSGVSVDVGQPRVSDQHRQIVAGQVARPSDHHVQSEARGAQGTGAVIQPPEVSTIRKPTNGAVSLVLSIIGL